VDRWSGRHYRQVRVEDGLADAAVRPRGRDDFGVCEALARAVHRRDRYPLVLPDDIRAFLAPEGQLAAWIVECGSMVVGHIALHGSSPGPLTTVVYESMGVGPSGVGVVSRLMVSPELRGRGLGRRLLVAATAEARRRALLPVLDVVTSYVAAIAFYEAAGWQRIGRIAIPMPNGELVDEYVFVAPA